MSKTIGVLLLFLFLLSSAVSFFVSKIVVPDHQETAVAASQEARDEEETDGTTEGLIFDDTLCLRNFPSEIKIETVMFSSEQSGTFRFEISYGIFGTNETGIYAELPPVEDGRREWIYPDSVMLYKVCGKDTVSLKMDSSLYADEDILEGKKYSYFAIACFDGHQNLTSAESEKMSYYKPWFSKSGTSMFAGSLIFTFFLVFFIRSAGRGKKYFIRKLSGIDAVDEAIGRATEMGKDVLFIPGIMDMDDVQTIAGMIILGRVARRVANYESKLSVPSIAPVAYNTAKEIVRQAYIQEGRPDSYDENSVFYLTGDQFGYAAAVDGIMVREKPATVFLMGHFYAESLILAETGHSIGAIQISGTADPSQLPFFVAACDYTLIGEEFFAASAYMSNDPHLIGSLKAQDFGKATAITAIVAGSILASFGVNIIKNLFFTG